MKKELRIENFINIEGLGLDQISTPCNRESGRSPTCRKDFGIETNRYEANWKWYRGSFLFGLQQISVDWKRNENALIINGTLRSIPPHCESTLFPQTGKAFNL